MGRTALIAGLAVLVLVADVAAVVVHDDTSTDVAGPVEPSAPSSATELEPEQTMTDLASTPPEPSDPAPSATPSVEPAPTAVEPTTPPPTPTPTATLPPATPFDPEAEPTLGPGRYEAVLARGVSVSFTVPEGQSYESFALPPDENGVRAGVGLVERQAAGVSGVAIYTAYGVGRVEDGQVVVAGLEDVPGSWATYPGFTVGPGAPAEGPDGRAYATVGWRADFNGGEPVAGRGSRADLFAFTTVDGAPGFTFAEDGDVGSSWLATVDPAPGLERMAVVVDLFASGSVETVPPAAEAVRASVVFTQG